MNIEKDVERYFQAINIGYSVGEEKVRREREIDFHKMEEILFMVKIKETMWRLIFYVISIIL